MNFYHQLPGNVKGIALMLIGTLAVTINLIFVRQLSDDLPVFELVFLRYGFALLALSPFIFRAGVGKVFYSRRIGLHLLRGFIAMFSIALWYVGVTLVPLAQAVALNSLCAIFVAIGAILFLGEPSIKARWGAVIVGFVGMLIIVRPGVIPVSVGTWIVLGQAVMWAICLLFLKVLSRGDSSLTIVGFLYIFCLLFSLPFALYNWVQPQLEHLMLLALMGVCSSAGHMCFANAFRQADATVVMPVDFMRLAWAALVGLLVFHEVPEIWTLLGGVIILAATVYIALAERRHQH